jgi:hypothetical protein
VPYGPTCLERIPSMSGYLITLSTILLQNLSEKKEFNTMIYASKSLLIQRTETDRASFEKRIRDLEQVKEIYDRYAHGFAQAI